MSWMLEHFVVYLWCVHICSAGYYVELPIVLLYLLRRLVYRMLSKTRRNSRSLHRVIVYICYIYLDAWCITCCWGMSATSAGGGVRFHTAVDSTVSSCICLCHICSWFLPMSWTLDLSFCCLFVVRIYMFGWLCQATCSFVPTSMLGISHAVQNEKLWKFT